MDLHTSSIKEIPEIIESFPKAHKEERQHNLCELFFNFSTLQGFLNSMAAGANAVCVITLRQTHGHY